MATETQYPESLLVFPRGDDPLTFHGVPLSQAGSLLHNGTEVALYQFVGTRRVCFKVELTKLTDKNPTSEGHLRPGLSP
jgi:hypothetical protein